MSASQATRAFWGLVAALTASSLAEGAMLPFLVLWARRDAGLSGASAGLLFAALAIGELSGGLAGGVLADRLGGRRILLASTAGMTAGYGSLALIGAPALAIAAAFAAGLFESAFHPTAFALIADLRREDELHAAYGLARVGSNAGRIAGPLIGAAAALVSLASVFVAAAALLALGGAALLATLPAAGLGHADDSADELDHPPAGLRTLFADRRLALLVAAGGLLAVTFAWWEADGLVILRDQRQLSASAFALLFALAAAVTVAFQMPAVRWTRSRPVGRVLALGAAVQGAGLALLCLAATGLVVVALAVVAIALGQMLYAPVVTAFVARAAPRRHGARYQAAMSTTVDIGMALGPTSGLILAAALGAQALWLAAVPLCLVAGLASMRAARAPAAAAELQPS